MRRGQVLIETSLTVGVLLLFVTAIFAADILVSQVKIGEAVTVNVCESYAESPDLQDSVGGWASYLGEWRVRMPRMRIVVGDKVLETDSSGRLPVTPLETIPPQVFSCVSTMNLGGNIPFFGTIEITHNYQYTTFRRYGPVGENIPRSPERVENLRVGAFPFLPPLAVVPPIIPPRRRKGQALVEYALVMLPMLPFLVLAVVELLHMLFVLELSARGAVTMTYAAVGPNPSLVDIAFNTPRVACYFAQGEPVDCGGMSPYSASVPQVPDVTMYGYWGVVIAIN